MCSTWGYFYPALPVAAGSPRLSSPGPAPLPACSFDFIRARPAPAGSSVRRSRCHGRSEQRCAHGERPGNGAMSGAGDGMGDIIGQASARDVEGNYKKVGDKKGAFCRRALHGWAPPSGVRRARGVGLRVRGCREGRTCTERSCVRGAARCAACIELHARRSGMGLHAWSLGSPQSAVLGCSCPATAFHHISMPSSWCDVAELSPLCVLVTASPHGAFPDTSSDQESWHLQGSVPHGLRESEHFVFF